MEQSEELDNQQRSLEDRLHYLGGIIDGEGCITAAAGHTKTGHGHLCKYRRYIPNINVVNTDPVIIQEVMDTLDAVGIPYWASWRSTPSHPTWKRKCQIMIIGMKRCAKAASILMKYVVAKRPRLAAMQQWVDRRLNLEPKAPYTEEDYRLLNLIRASSIPLRDYTPNSAVNVDDDIVQAA